MRTTPFSARPALGEGSDGRHTCTPKTRRDAPNSGIYGRQSRGRVMMDDQALRQRLSTPRAERPEAGSPDSGINCPQCGLGFKTAQGLAGHRRLAHSARTARALDERNRELETQRQALERRAAELAQTEEATRRRETEVTRRKREIERTGPRSIGLAQCDDCGAWFDDSGRLGAHSRSVHPLEEKVAAEVGVSKGWVSDVWIEACEKSKRHPRETPEQIIERFWSGKDKKILRALLARNAAFELEKEVP